MRARPIRFVLATNNATASPESVVRRLEKVGVHVSENEVLSTAGATAGLLRGMCQPGSRVYVIGEAALYSALEDAGYEVATSHENVHAVVIGFDREVTYKKLAEASFAVAEGAIFIGTNPDPSFPVETGQAPGNGAILAAVQTTTGQDPIIVGKPEPHLYLQASSRLQTPNQEILVIGDRLNTDILGAQNAGMPSALMLTGVTTAADLEMTTVKPDWIFDDLFHLVQAFQT